MNLKAIGNEYTRESFISCFCWNEQMCNDLFTIARI